MKINRFSIFCILLIFIISTLPVSSQGWVAQEKPAVVETADETSNDEGDATDESGETDESDAADVEQAVDLAPGEWEIWLEMNDEIYPSWLLSTAGIKYDAANGEDELGESWGSVGIRICAPKDNCKVDLTISSANILRPTKYQAVLKKAGNFYYITPRLDFDYNTLARVIQPFPENIKVSVSIDGKPAVEKLETVNVRAVNDCIFSFTDEDGNSTEVSWTFAAYVNENHPAIHRIMSEAKDKDENPMTFSAYQGGKKDVLAEIESIWDVLAGMGLRYSSITTSSLAEKAVQGQFVRRVGEALAVKQANCVDGSVLMASILRRMGINVYLIVLPTHMFIAVKLVEDEDDVTSLKELTAIETTLLGQGSFADSLSTGKEEMKECAKELKAALKDPDMVSNQYSIVDIENARSTGVLPLGEPDAK